MRTYLDCIPCFVRQSLEATRFVTSDEEIQERILRETLQVAQQLDWSQPPASLAQQLHRRIRELTAQDDPYFLAKLQQNALAIAYCKDLGDRMSLEDCSLETVVRLAIAGNIIDLGVKSGLSELDIRSELDGALSAPLDGDVDRFARAIGAAGRILYLTDNAGEIVLDRLLIERLPMERVTVAVRGRPVINDATMLDAQAVGITDLVHVIDNGSDAPGTIIEDCSEEFQQHFQKADLIIAKGQGNHETLMASTRPIYFLLRVKCAVIARSLECPLGRMVLHGRNVNGSVAPRV